ncbi:MAG: peptidase T [Bacillota bacterium]|jgi:tripeptide aminopeptidase|nr:peptidase T [Bacillota bacterium]NLL26890.1 peptidase T [Erysipelotrichia bacterium]
MKIEERFINYTKIDTTSDAESKTCPSTPNQLILAEMLVEELKQLGVEDARMDENGFVYGTVESNVDHQTDVVGLLAHLDTSDATSGRDIKARIIRDYDGKDILLSEGIYTRVSDYPFLKDLKGKDLIVTDGTTLLGGDDKAGIAIIMDFIQYLYENPEVKHGKIMICFTPDEEIGSGILKIDLKQFVCDYAYTLDGGPVNCVTYENFNAANAVVTFSGNSIHPGDAKNKMINATQLAIDFHNMLPVNQRPEFTEKREGFNHLLGIVGDCQQAKSTYIIRNHDLDLLHQQMRHFELITMHINEMYNRHLVELQIKESYYNMKECLTDKMFIVEQAAKAIEQLGYKVEYDPIRGGTDGAHLSFMGIATPNLGTGGRNCHGNHELVIIDEMKEMVKVLANIINIVVERGVRE